MQTIEYLLGIKSVKDRANIKNQNGFTALDIVEHCPIRDLRTIEIKELLLQAGVHKSFYMRPDSNPGSPPDNPPPPPQGPQRWCKARDWISMFWKKYFKYDHGWLQQVYCWMVGTHTYSLPGSLSDKFPQLIQIHALTYMHSYI